MINYLEKVFIYGNQITIEQCEKLCSTISLHHFNKYYQYLKDDNLKDAITILYQVYDYGYSVIDILDYLFYYTKICNELTENIRYEVVIIVGFEFIPRVKKPRFVVLLDNGTKTSVNWLPLIGRLIIRRFSGSALKIF